VSLELFFTAFRNGNRSCGVCLYRPPVACSLQAERRSYADIGGIEKDGGPSGWRREAPYGKGAERNGDICGKEENRRGDGDWCL